jgi:hypothetical protein
LLNCNKFTEKRYVTNLKEEKLNHQSQKLNNDNDSTTHPQFTVGTGYRKSITSNPRISVEQQQPLMMDAQIVTVNNNLLNSPKRNSNNAHQAEREFKNKKSITYV